MNVRRKFDAVAMRKAMAVASCICVFCLVALGVLGIHAMQAGSEDDGYVDPSVLARYEEEEAQFKEYVASRAECAGSDEGSTDEASSPLPEYVSDQVLVRLENGCSAEELQKRVSGLDYVTGSEVAESGSSISWATVQLVEGTDVRKAAQQLVADGVAQQAQPNFVYSIRSDADAARAPNDETRTAEAPEGESTKGNLDAAGVEDGFFGTTSKESEDTADGANALSSTPGLPLTLQANSYVNDSYVSFQDGLQSIEADRAYDYLRGNQEMAGNPVSVAILDSGAYVDHPDLKANIVDCYDAVDNLTKVQLEKNGKTLLDWDYDDSHGTHVAGIVSAVTDNNRGVAGSSANAGLVPVRVTELQQGGGVGVTSASLLRGYEFVCKNAPVDNIKVVNLSIGHNGDKFGVGTEDRLVLDWIWQASDEGILTVIAAGNEGETGAYRDFPSYYAETAMGVIGLEYGDSASSSYIARSDYSNYNMPGTASEQIAAPGSYVYSTKAYADDSSEMSEQYGLLSGTSQAAPFVSGAAALAWRLNPWLSTDEMKSLLMSNAGDSFSDAVGMGKINTYNLACDVAADGGSYFSGDTSLMKGLSSQLTPSRSGSWSYSSSNPSVASVDAAGSVTGKSGGAAVIRGYDSSQDRSIYQVVTVHDASISGASSVTKGYATPWRVDDPKTNNNGTWIWESNNKSVATVNENTGLVSGKKAGTAKITATLMTNFAVQVSKTITVVQPKSNTTTPTTPAPTTSKVGKQAMHRLYNPYSGEHFYTASMAELRNLASLGWTYEGVGWVAPTTGANVYRLYNRFSGDHHFTTNVTEKDACVRAGWTYEGVGWKSGGSKPVYREYNPYASAFYHNYTASITEHNTLCSIGWKGEGIGWYGLS